MSPEQRKALDKMIPGPQYTAAELGVHHAKTMDALRRAGAIRHTNPGAHGEKVCPKFIKKWEIVT